MLAARDQENLVYAHQTNAASKPLNPGFRDLPSKAPGNKPPKTPFKPSTNDENSRNVIGGSRAGFKTLGKGVENALEKRGKVDGDTFVTPIAPRNRAPLGIKTTNAKARIKQTPAPRQEIAKPDKTLKKASTARKSVKSKIQVAVTEPVGADVLSKDEDSDVLDPEYCPPPTVDLADPPEVITYDDRFPYLRGNNLCRGYGEVYDIPRDEYGVSLRERKEEEAYAEMVQGLEDQLREQMSDPRRKEEAHDIANVVTRPGPKTILQADRNVGTCRAKSAVTALSDQPPSNLPSAATKQTASSMQKKLPNKALLGRKKAVLLSTDPSPRRHTAAIAASKQTIGYSKGRSVSSVLPAKKPRPVEQSRIPSPRSQGPCGAIRRGSELQDRLEENGLFGEDGGEDMEGLDWGISASGDEDDEEILELPMLGERLGIC